MSARTMLLYGDSGASKTTQLYMLAKYWLAQDPNRIIRLISADGGGYAPFRDSGLIDSGQVEVFDYTTRVKALADIHRLCTGYWPRKRRDGSLYFASDEKCKTDFTSGKIYAYMIEGITSICDIWLNHMRKQADGVGFKLSVRYQEDEFTIGGIGEGHYGLAQNELNEVFVNGFRQLPIDWLVVTALVDKGNGRKTISKYGPKAAGSALTSVIPSWFETTLHLEGVDFQVKNDDGSSIKKSGKIAWFTDHEDRQTDVPYIAKCRLIPELIPKLEEKFPRGYVQLKYDRGVEYFVQTLEELSMEYRKERTQNEQQTT